MGLFTRSWKKREFPETKNEKEENPDSILGMTSAKHAEKALLAKVLPKERSDLDLESATMVSVGKGTKGYVCKFESFPSSLLHFLFTSFLDSRCDSVVVPMFWASFQYILFFSVVWCLITWFFALGWLCCFFFLGCSPLFFSFFCYMLVFMFCGSFLYPFISFV